MYFGEFTWNRFKILNDKHQRVSTMKQNYKQNCLNKNELMQSEL